MTKVKFLKQLKKVKESNKKNVLVTLLDNTKKVINKENFILKFKEEDITFFKPF